MQSSFSHNKGLTAIPSTSYPGMFPQTGSHSSQVPEMGHQYSRGMRQRLSGFDQSMHPADPQSNDFSYNDSGYDGYGSINTLEVQENEPSWSPHLCHNGYGAGLADGLDAPIGTNNGMGMWKKRQLKDTIEFRNQSSGYSSSRQMKKPRLGECHWGEIQHQTKTQSGL